MRALALAAVALLVAGCADGGSGGEGSRSETTTGGGLGNATAPPLSTTATGLPFVALGEMDLRISLAADGRVHRARLVVFEEALIDGIGVVQEGGGGGGGGGPGGGGGEPQEFGFVVLPQDGTPATQVPCTDAADDGAYDTRTHNGDPDLPLAPGLYDLWAWSSSHETFVLEVDGGGDPVNLTAQPHNWTTTASAPAVTKSGPAQSTASLDEAVDLAAAGLVLAGFTSPNGYPEEQATLEVRSGPAACATGEQPSGGGGFGGGGGGFNGLALAAAAFLPAGDASVAATFTATVSPLGEPSAAIVVLQPA